MLNWTKRNHNKEEHKEKPAEAVIQEERPRLGPRLRRLYTLAEDLLQEPVKPHALKNLMFMAVLPLQAEALYGWADGVDYPRFLDDGLPRPIWEELYRRKALPKFAEAPTIQVDLRHTPAVSFPWQDTRMIGVMRLIDTWRYDPSNHRASFYRPLGILLFYNGLHSGAIGVARHTGTLPAQELDLSRAFEAGLEIAWHNDRPVAVLPIPGGTLEEPFAHPAYGLLWALGRLFWTKGVAL